MGNVIIPIWLLSVDSLTADFKELGIEYKLNCPVSLIINYIKKLNLNLTACEEAAFYSHGLPKIWKEEKRIL